jgi:hypothetical protein
VAVARRVVLRTNHWPGLKTLYGRAYDLGLGFTVNRLGALPGVLAVMLRANVDGRAWVPGLSDYDLTVLTDRHDTSAAIRFLDDLWRRYRSIKRCVPQVGEMEVMDVEGYSDWLDFGPMPTASMKRVHPLLVKDGDPDVERIVRRMPRPPEPRELLLDALTRFGRFAVPAWLDDDRCGNCVTRRRARHLLDNVVRRLSRLGAGVEPTGTGDARGVITVFQALTEACRLMKPPDGEPAAAIDPDVGSIAIDVIAPLGTFCEEVLRRARARSRAAIAWRPYMSVDRVNLIFVVPDEIPEDELERLLKALGAVPRTADGFLTGILPRGVQGHVRSVFPMVASDSMWDCWRALSPFDAVAVAATARTLVGGVDCGRPVPSLPALRRGAAVQYASLLPLKNNWRQSRGRPTGQSYAALVNHAKGCASVFTGPVRTVPAELEFSSLEEGYQAAHESLHELRTRLRAAG